MTATPMKKKFDAKRNVWVQDTDAKKRIINEGHHITDLLDLQTPTQVTAQDHGQPGDADSETPAASEGDQQDDSSQDSTEDGSGDGDDGDEENEGDDQQESQSDAEKPQSKTSEEDYTAAAEKEQEQLQQQFDNKQKLSDIFDRWTLSAFDNFVYMVNKEDPWLHVRFAHSKKAKNLTPQPNEIGIDITAKHGEDFKVMTSEAFRAQFDMLLENAA